VVLRTGVVELVLVLGFSLGKGVRRLLWVFQLVLRWRVGVVFLAVVLMHLMVRLLNYRVLRGDLVVCMWRYWWRGC
jgi:hypothetical protein